MAGQQSAHRNHRAIQLIDECFRTGQLAALYAVSLATVRLRHAHHRLSVATDSWRKP